MNVEQIISRVDHTLLNVNATWDEIKTLCDDAIQFKTASVCIPASYVKRASEYAQGKIKVCTVVGFPNGYSTTEVKAFETQDAINNGADEIDMVINIGFVKDKEFDLQLNEIKKVRQACMGKVLKVIIETCLLTQEEKMTMCEIVSQSGADYIKTSTGFSSCGATFEDVKLLRENVDKRVKVKAAGGVKSFEDAQRFIDLGADRLGTSRLVNILKNSKGG